MDLPKFLIADNSENADKIYILHTEYPRFIMDISTDDIELLEEVDKEDENEIGLEIEKLIQQALDFYDSEMASYDGAQE